MKYYRYDLVEKIGEYEHTDSSVIALPEDADLEEEARTLARENRGSEESDYDATEEAYWFGDGVTMVPGFHPISLEDYNLYRECRKRLLV